MLHPESYLVGALLPALGMVMSSTGQVAVAHAA